MITHPACASVAPNSSPIVGSATFVIEPFITITNTAKATTASSARTGNFGAAPIGSVCAGRSIRRTILAPMRGRSVKDAEEIRPRI